MANEISENILNLIIEYDRELTSFYELKKNRRTKENIGLGIAVILGLASVAVPVVGIPITVISLGFGTESIKNVVNSRKKEKSLETNWNNRPIGILFHLHKKFNK